LKDVIYGVRALYYLQSIFLSNAYLMHSLFWSCFKCYR